MTRIMAENGDGTDDPFKLLEGLAYKSKLVFCVSEIPPRPKVAENNT